MQKAIGPKVLGYDQATMYYGKEPAVKDKWKEIIQIENVEKRHLAVDELIKVMQTGNNGFLGASEKIIINQLFNLCFTIDDKELYHLYFDNLKYACEHKDTLFKNGDVRDRKIISRAIIATEKMYFGGFSPDMRKRMAIASMHFDENDEPVIPSIKDFRGQNAAACVELASVAHNLWLMSGEDSYLFNSKTTDFANSNDGHAFTFIKFDDITVLYDVALQRIKKYTDKDPIKDIESGKPFSFDGDTYINAPNKTLTPNLQ